MNKDGIDELFERLQGEFDLGEPRAGHQERFLEKLARGPRNISRDRERASWWKPLAIAASVAALALLGLQLLKPEATVEQKLVKIAPEVGRTEFYFVNLIERQVKELQSNQTPGTAPLVEDALAQLKRMERDYGQLERDLLSGGDSKIIIRAMINNFQTRIDLLREVSLQIENIKNLNPQHYESETI